MNHPKTCNVGKKKTDSRPIGVCRLSGWTGGPEEDDLIRQEGVHHTPQACQCERFPTAGSHIAGSLGLMVLQLRRSYTYGKYSAGVSDGLPLRFGGVTARGGTSRHFSIF